MSYHEAVPACLRGTAARAGDSAPNKKHYDGSNGRANKTGTLSCAIPAESLS